MCSCTVSEGRLFHKAIELGKKINLSILDWGKINFRSCPLVNLVAGVANITWQRNINQVMQDFKQQTKSSLFSSIAIQLRSRSIQSCNTTSTIVIIDIVKFKLQHVFCTASSLSISRGVPMQLRMLRIPNVHQVSVSLDLTLARL